MLCPHGPGQWSWPLSSGLQPLVLVRKWWPHLLGLCLLILGSDSSSPSDLCMHGLIFRVLFPSLLPMSVSFRPGWKCFCRCSSSMDIVGSQPHHETPEFSTGAAWKTPSFLLTSAEVVDWPTHCGESLSSCPFAPVSEHTIWEAEHFPNPQGLVPFYLAVHFSIDLFLLMFYYKQQGEPKLHSTLSLEFFSVRYPRSSLAKFYFPPHRQVLIIQMRSLPLHIKVIFYPLAKNMLLISSESSLEALFNVHIFKNILLVKISVFFKK